MTAKQKPRTEKECFNCSHYSVCKVVKEVIKLQNEISFARGHSVLFGKLAENCIFYMRYKE